MVCANLALAFASPADAQELVRHTDEIATEADSLAVPAIARLARALPAVSGSPDAIREAHAVHVECEVARDRWGAALALVLCAVGYGRSGDEQANESLIESRYRATP